jgi:hypothetical protein
MREGAQMSQRKCWSSEVDSPLLFLLTSPLTAPGHGRLADSSAAPASSCSYGRFSADISGRPWRAFQLLGRRQQACQSLAVYYTSLVQT